MQVIGYILDITEVLIIIGLVWQVQALKKRIDNLESKNKE